MKTFEINTEDGTVVLTSDANGIGVEVFEETGDGRCMFIPDGSVVELWVWMRAHIDSKQTRDKIVENADLLKLPPKPDMEGVYSYDKTEMTFTNLWKVGGFKDVDHADMWTKWFTATTQLYSSLKYEIKTDADGHVFVAVTGYPNK